MTDPEIIPARLVWHHAGEPVDLDVPLVHGAIDDRELVARVQLPPLVRAIALEPTESLEPGVLAWLVVDADTEDTLGVLEVVAGAGA